MEEVKKYFKKAAKVLRTTFKRILSFLISMPTTEPSSKKYITLYFSTNGIKKTDCNIYFTPEEVSYWKEHQLKDDWMIENKIKSIINRLREHQAKNETDIEINEYYNNWYKGLTAPELAELIELHRIYRNQSLLKTARKFIKDGKRRDKKQTFRPMRSDNET